MGNCPASLSGRYSTIHDMGSEEGDVDQKIGELGRSSSGGSLKDGKVFEYKTASSSDDDDAIEARHMQRLRAKDVVVLQGSDEGSSLYELFDQYSSYTSMASTPYNGIENEKTKMKKEKNDNSEEKGTNYDRKPVHPETILKVSHVYYLRPACAATTADSDRHISSNISNCPASGTAAAIRAATDQNKKEKKKVRFSDHVIFIEPPAPSSSEHYNHHRQLDCVFFPTVQPASAVPNLAGARPLSGLENTAQAAQNNIVRHDYDDDGRGGDGAPIDERQVAGKGSDVVRVKLLLSKRELCDLLAASDRYQQEQQQQHHSQLMVAATSGRAASHLLPTSIQN